MWEQVLTLEERVVEWTIAEQHAAQDVEWLRRTPWFQFGERRSLRDAVRHGERRAEELRSELPPYAVRDVAWDLLHRAWWRIAAELTTRNPYHRDLEVERESRVEEISQSALSSKLRPAWGYGWESLGVEQVPGLAGLLTPGPARNTLREIATRTRAVAEDPVFLSQPGFDSRGDKGLVVQHMASELRAIFTERRDDPGFGSVFSKPYSIKSIDPEKPWDIDWERYAGLGIGTRIYLEAARLMPELRWSAGATTDYSDAVRRKLHARDPWRWAGPCEECASRGTVWQRATRADFAHHLRAPS